MLAALPGGSAEGDHAESDSAPPALCLEATREGTANKEKPRLSPQECSTAHVPRKGETPLGCFTLQECVHTSTALGVGLRPLAPKCSLGAETKPSPSGARGASVPEGRGPARVAVTLSGRNTETRRSL